MQKNGIKEEVLLELLRASPQEGLREIIRLYGGTVKALCTNVLSGFSEADIEEATADCFVAFWQSLNRITVKVSLKSYLLGVARNCALDKMKKLIKHKQSITYEELELGIELDMSDMVSQNINTQIVQETLSSMPSLEREIFLRRYYRYEKIKSIASQMNLEAKQVENKLYRYKAKLRKALMERGVIL